MGPQIVKWIELEAKNIRGESYLSRFPDLLDSFYGATLLSEIVLMEPKQPIAFDKAVSLVDEKWTEAFWSDRQEYEAGGCFWYACNFVSWIASLGYHIELTGDEFEPYVSSQIAA